MTLSRTVILVLILLVFGTVFFVAQPDPPELVRAVSDDGAFRVEALASEATELSVITTPGGASTARVSPVYEVTATWLVGGELGAAVVSLASSLDPADHLLAVWNGDLEVWSPRQGTEWAGGIFSYRLSLPGKMALFQRQDVEIPRRYEQVVSELITNRPSKTKRAHISLAYALETDDYVLIRQAQVTAACGGNLQAPRGSVEHQKVVEPITLMVNGREREGWIQVVARWELEEGCTEGEAFERVD